MSAYRLAIEQTETTILRRAKYFRNQVVAVVVVALVIVVSAAVLGFVSVLAAALCLIPLCGAFLFADSTLVNEWRSELLSAWTTGQLDLAAFLPTIRVHPQLPTQTLEAMLATLPSAGSLVEEQAILIATRQALAAESAAVHRMRSDALLFKVIGSGVVVAVVLAVVWARSWWPLIGLSALVVLPIVRLWMQRRRRARCNAEVALFRAQPGFSETDYARVLASLQA